MAAKRPTEVSRAERPRPGRPCVKGCEPAIAGKPMQGREPLCGVPSCRHDIKKGRVGYGVPQPRMLSERLPLSAGDGRKMTGQRKKETSLKRAESAEERRARLGQALR